MNYISHVENGLQTRIPQGCPIVATINNDQMNQMPYTNLKMQHMHSFLFRAEAMASIATNKSCSVDFPRR